MLQEVSGIATDKNPVINAICVNQKSKLDNLAAETLNNPLQESNTDLKEKKVVFIPSEDGVPRLNNLKKLEALYEAKKGKIPERKRTILDELLEKPRPLFFNSTLEEQRQATLSHIEAILHNELITIEQLDNQFDHPDTLDFLRKLGLLSPATATYLLVHSVLGGRSIKRLGTEKHQHLIPLSNKFLKRWCFAMTEFRGGSDITGFETTATYDPKTREFILDSPTIGSTKIFIGGAAKNATDAVVLARLITKGIDYCVHAFIVPVRRDGVNLPGVKTKDMGPKYGLNGVDNGYMAFKKVRIPYDNFLDFYSEISESGEYIKKNGNENPLVLIYKLLTQLSRGRQSIAFNAANSLSFLTAVFACYPPGIGKSFHKQLLVNFLSKAFALDFAKPIYLGKNVDDHIPASLMKAVASEMGMKFFMEILNYYGNSPHMRHVALVIESYKRDFAATLTYEGDNNVLLQLTARDMLKKAYKDYLDLISLDLSLTSIKRKIAILTKAITERLAFKELPYYLMKRKVFELQREIGERMRASHGDPKKVVKIWNESCQVDGITMSKIHAQSLIIKEFYKKAKELDRAQNTDMWSKLYEIYAWETCQQYLPEVKKPDLSGHYEALKPKVYDMLSEFEFKMEWLHALIPPPSSSESYDDSEDVCIIDDYERLCAL